MKHIRPLPELTLPERSDLLAKLQKNSVIERRSYKVADECWVFQGKWEDGKGFKKIKVKGRAVYVHRVGKYAMTGEDIPAGLVLDHRCRVRGCWRPSHTEPVTTAINTERGNGCWVFGQGAQTGRVSGAAPNGEGGCLGQQLARTEVTERDRTDGFVITVDPNTGESDAALVEMKTHIVGPNWRDVDEPVERLWSEMRAAPEVDVKSIAGDVFGSSRGPTFCERHKLEGWLPRNVERVVNWMRRS